MSTAKLDKFIRRFNQGDFGYCRHRLRKFTRRHHDATEAIKFVVKNHATVLTDLDEYPRFVEELLNLAGVARRNEVGHLDFAKPALDSGLNDGNLQRVWPPTDNRLWDFDFATPKYSDDTVTVTRDFSVDAKAAAEAGEQCRTGNIRPDNPNRPTRANRLAMKIREWAVAPTDKCFRQAVWAVGVDALFEKTVFVPSEIAEDGTTKARGPVCPDGQRFYVCYVDTPADGESYTEAKLSAFIAMALGDAKTIGVGFKLADGRKLLVRRETLEELAAKVGPNLTGGKEVNDAETQG